MEDYKTKYLSMKQKYLAIKPKIALQQNKNVMYGGVVIPSIESKIFVISSQDMFDCVRQIMKHLNVRSISNPTGTIDSSSIFIGFGIAGNHGRPGGSLTNVSHPYKYVSSHKIAQEEAVWNMIVNKTYLSELFQLINKRYGLKSSGTMTEQGIDFTITKDISSYSSSFSVVVEQQHYRSTSAAAAAAAAAAAPTAAAAADTRLSAPPIVSPTSHPPSSGNLFDEMAFGGICIAFAGAPNANYDTNILKFNPTEIVGHNYSMMRTQNAKARTDFVFFKKCILVALCAILRQMLVNRVTLAIVPKIGAGLYAGEHKGHMNNKLYLLALYYIKRLLPEGSFYHGIYLMDYISSDTIPMSLTTDDLINIDATFPLNDDEKVILQQLANGMPPSPHFITDIMSLPH